MAKKQQEQSDTNIVKSMTVKVLCGVTKEDDVFEYMRVKAKSKSRLCRIVGAAYTFVSKPNSKDPKRINHCLHGDFLGLNLETGEVFESRKLYLPAEAADMIVSQLTSRQDQNATVQFDVIIQVVPDKTPAGYTYVLAHEETPETISLKAQFLEKLKGQKLLPPAKKDAA